MPRIRIVCLLLSIVLLGSTSYATDEGPFQFKQTDLMKAAPRAVFVATMGDYRTPAVSGTWDAWATAAKGKKHHQPDVINASGLRDIGSCFHPIIGPYDMSNPDVAEYHCQLLKMAGVDGISFNLSFFDRDPWRRKSMNNYVNSMKRYGLRGIVRFENKRYRKVYPDAKSALAASYADMDSWLGLMAPVQYKVGHRPVFMLFTFALSPAELAAWKDKYPPDSRPLILTFGANPRFKGVVDGRFGWAGIAPEQTRGPAPYKSDVSPAQARANERFDRQRAAQLLNRGQLVFYMAGVSPGFDSIGCWGWGSGPRKVERDNGNTYRYRWEQTLRTNLSTVLIPTWNDWCEGTTIEPAAEYGDKYLAMTRDYAMRFKHAAPLTGNLMVPTWLYKVRKSPLGPAAAVDMQAASSAIAAGDFTKAEQIVTPWAKRLHRDAHAPGAPLR